jgi:hypothetical protein
VLALLVAARVDALYSCHGEPVEALYFCHAEPIEARSKIRCVVILSEASAVSGVEGRRRTHRCLSWFDKLTMTTVIEASSKRVVLSWFDKLTMTTVIEASSKRVVCHGSTSSP